MEEFMEKDMELAVDDVTLKLASVPYARLTVTSNPGRWPTCTGLALLGLGLLGSIAWPARRLWLREGSEHVEAAGNLPLALVEGREA
jgi:cytochrome c biogenesis protein ResB